MKHFLLFSLLFSFSILHGQISSTYVFSNISTNLSDFDDGCVGVMSIQLPTGGDIEVLSINISYSMTAFGDNWKSDQRSRVRCLNNDNVEATFSGTGTGGTQDYQRDNVTIANGTYDSGTILQFQMEAYRTYDDGSGIDCSSLGNRVDNASWTIELIVDHLVPLVGISTDTPDQSLSVGGKLSIGNDFKAPTPGTLRYNDEIDDFEGWTGTKWKSMTYSPKLYSYEQHPITDSYSSTFRDSLIAFPDSLLIEEAGTYMCTFDLTFNNLKGNTTTLISDIRAEVFFSVYNTNNFRYVGPNIVGLPNGFTYYFRNRETLQMHKVINIPTPNSYMHIRYKIFKNACCADPTDVYTISDVKMTAVKLD